eukprot:1608152-Amphidinium_carterae.2
MATSVFTLSRTSASANETIDIQWKASLTASEKLHWHVRHVLPSIGFEYNSEGTKTCRQYNRLLKMVQPILLNLGMEECSHTGKSTNALRSARRQGEVSDVELSVSDEYWVSTECLVLLLLAYTQHRNSMKVRRSSVACLQLLLQSCVIPWSDFMTEVTDDARVGCWVGLDEDSCCQHLAGLQSAPVWGRRGVVDAGMRLSLLYTEMNTCQALKMHCSCVIARLALAIEGSRLEWSSQHMPGSSSMLQGPSGRRRRLDIHEKGEAKKLKIGDATRDDNSKRMVLLLRSLACVALHVWGCRGVYCTSELDRKKIERSQNPRLMS